MQNKENFEEFIKREVNQIKFEDADSMWQEFQVRLEKEKPASKKGGGYWTGIFSFFLFITLGGFLLGNIFNEAKISDVNKEEGILTEKESVVQSSSELNQAQSANNLLKTDDDENSTQTGRKISPNVQEEAQVNSGNPTSADINFRGEKVNAAKKVIDILLNQNKQVDPISGVMDSVYMQKDFESVYFEQAGFEEMNGMESLDKSIKSLEPIAGIEYRELLTLNSEKNPPLVTVNYEWEAPKSKNHFFSIENSFANNGIRQHALGFGAYFPFKNDFGVKVQAGGSLDVGYSFSQDSLFILNGLSIKETRKDKDLKNIWNGYLDLGIFHRKNHWQFGLGFRGSYALFNQFHFVETTWVTHLGNFNNSVGEIHESDRKGNWSGVNRMSFDAYLNINYQINTNYSVGLFAGKRLNELINKDMAKQAYSNTPVKFGVVINKYF